jgi:hypothetical protein
MKAMKKTPKKTGKTAKKAISPSLFPFTITVNGNPWEVRLGGERELFTAEAEADSNSREIIISLDCLVSMERFSNAFWHEVEHACLAYLMSMNPSAELKMTLADIQELVAESTGQTMQQIIRSLPKWIKEG